MNYKLVRFFLLLLAIILVGVMGCATAPKITEVPPPTQQGLGELSDLLLQGKAQIQATCNAARALSQKTGEVPQSNITQLTEEVGKLEAIRAKTWGVHQDVQAKAKEYFAEWDQQLQTMSGKLAEQGQKRRAASMASFETLKVRGRELGEIYDPCVAKLSESVRYLETDRTSEGLKVVKPQISEQLGLEPELANRIDAVVSQIDTMMGGK